MENSKVMQFLAALKAKSTTPATPKQLGGKFKVWATKPFLRAKVQLSQTQYQSCEIGLIKKPNQTLYALAQKKGNKWIVLVHAPSMDKLIQRAIQ